MRTFAAILLSCAIWPLSVAQAALSPAPQAATGSALRSTYEQMRERLERSPFKQPLHLVAEEEESHLNGHAYAILPHSFAETSKAFADPAQWCEILLLPFNIKHCEAAGGASGRGAITLMLGRKHSTPLDKAYPLHLTFGVASRTQDYIRVMLQAPEGPFSTRDYEIVLELTPLDEKRTFLHLGYRYGYGNLARAAMRAYLATIGANKVGFTTQDDNGTAALVRGMRGVMERNTMRYYLAIQAYLRTMRLAPDERTPKMVDDWYAAVLRYPRQLKELDREEYVSMKMREYERMHSRDASPAPRTASSSP